MLLVRTVDELVRCTDEWRRAGESSALVPTMGGLHAGHLQLVQVARRAADRVAVSLFVNPAQFNCEKDYQTYPRDETDDLTQLKVLRVDLAFAPSVEAVYPPGSKQGAVVTAGDLGRGLCGDYRPGHFDGVATVVTRLFNIFRSDYAVFGEKDYQQLCIVREIAENMDFDMQIISAQTVREKDGLAMSSRNLRMTPQERARAPALYRALCRAGDALSRGAGGFGALQGTAKQEMSAAGLRPEYVEVRRTETLKPAIPGRFPVVILAAAWIGDTRLIDNVIIKEPRQQLPLVNNAY